MRLSSYLQCVSTSTMATAASRILIVRFIRPLAITAASSLDSQILTSVKALKVAQIWRYIQTISILGIPKSLNGLRSTCLLAM